LNKKVFSLVETANFTGLDKEEIGGWIAKEWVTPTLGNALDEEDIARLQLIHQLLYDFGSNEEAIPLILHLVDQLYYLRNQLRYLGKNKS
jgi:chaperone modulatory protein CbpM